MYQRGGIVIGPSHAEGGVPFILQDTGRNIEEEGQEINIPRELLYDTAIYTMRGTNAQVLDQILRKGGISLADKVSIVKSGDVVICKRSAWNDQVHKRTGTIEQILHAINTSNGCNPIVGPAVTVPATKAKNGMRIPLKQKIKDWQIEDPNSPRWQKKKAKIEELSNNIHRLRMNVSRDLGSQDERTALTALVVAIMDKTAERIGNDDSADNGHFGVTGFRKKHIDVVGSNVHLNYVGKSGTKHKKSFSDERIARALKRAIRNSKSKFIFETSDGFRIKSDKVNRYLEPFKISAKDMRGYNANKWLVEKLEKAKYTDSIKERRKEFNKALKEVAMRVGHGKGTLRKHYMIPELPIQYIDHNTIINMKNLGYYQEGSKIEDPSIEQKISERLKEKQKTKEFKDTGIAKYTRKYRAAYDVITFSDLVEIEKDTVNEKTAAGVVVTDKATIVEGGDTEAFESGYAFRTEYMPDAKGESRMIYRLITNPHIQKHMKVTGGKKSNIFIFALKYFTDQKAGYGIADGVKEQLPNSVKALPEAKLEDAKKEAIEYFKNKTTTMNRPELFEEGRKITNFDFNSSGNLSATINGDEYEIIYRDDKSRLYDMFKNGVKINSNKNIQRLIDQMEDGGKAKSCGCFHSYLKTNNPELCQRLVEENINEVPDLRAQVDAAHKMWKGGHAYSGGGIVESDIKPEARFKTADGTIWIIDKVYPSETFGTAVETSMEGYKKGNYKDTIEEVVAFLNEEKSQKIK